ncbi:DUF3102 domain-containing protein [Rhizobium sp. GN54]|uniref:DUF3102 domain-containing protein n=1 Tax=Rhizobium sp. GN54 TaxID=2898150 RepID=UPI001E44F49E|nr:DUF3102 domain-containing protein [Rhizobium sp. GN54]MCD2185214.1 DUF3102 domain-containing protein [Rhizobium sp. GN54]
MPLTFKQIQPVPAVALSYSYAGLDAETAACAKKAAIAIRHRLGEAQAHFIEIGKDLVAVKEKLPHGEFTNWIDAEFGMSIRTAQNLMSAVRLMHSGGIDQKTLEAIPQKLVYELAAPKVPAEIVIEVVEAVEGGKPLHVPDVLHKIAISKQEQAALKAKEAKLKAKAAKLKGKSPDEIAKAEKAQAKKDAKEAEKAASEAAAREARKQAANDAVAMIKGLSAYSQFLALVRNAGWEFDRALAKEVQEAMVNA